MPLTKDRNTAMRDGDQLALRVAAGAQIFAGSIVVTNATGYADKGQNAGGLTYIGRAENAVDNTNGGDGDVSIKVRRNKLFKWKNSGSDPVAQASFGLVCYIEDDETVSATGGGTQSIAGIVVGVEPDGVWVEAMFLTFLG